MNLSSFPGPTALIAGHPGHELRLFRWLELARPTVFVLTDGSGSGRARTASTLDLLHRTGSTPGAVLGAMTDVEMYDAILSGDVTPLVAVTVRIADAVAALGVRSVVADPFEFYNPTHDLCSVVAALAIARAQAVTSSPIERYDYPLLAAPSGTGIVIDLGPDDAERKLAAARRFENLTTDVDLVLEQIGAEGVARELIRPISGALELPVAPAKPFYETHGEERVAAGRYRTVLRYEEHFVPFVRSLAAALGLLSLIVEPARTSLS